MHIVGAKKVANQIEVAMRLLNIIRGKSVIFDEEELEIIVNQRNASRFSPYGGLYGLRLGPACSGMTAGPICQSRFHPPF